jgi:zeta-carotene desaturase
VVRESMKSPEARQMGVPTVPLTDLYNAAGDYVRARGGTLHFRRPLESFIPDPTQVTVRPRSQNDESNANQEEVFDYLILALPFDALDRVLPAAPESVPLREDLNHFETAPITGIHLWFDRQISDLDHAVLLDRTIQWMFHKSRLQPMRSQAPSPAEVELAAERRENAAHGASRGIGQNEDTAPEGRKNDGSATNGSYIELVVSSSKSLIDKSRAEIVDLALREVREFFPAAREANLVKSTVIKELHATYSPRPGIDTYRPAPITKWPRVFLAGDWTATGWPATMEGAVRSGYHAAEVLARAAGHKDPQFLSPDLPPTGLMRLFY